MLNPLYLVLLHLSVQGPLTLSILDCTIWKKNVFKANKINRLSLFGCLVRPFKEKVSGEDIGQILHCKRPTCEGGR